MSASLERAMFGGGCFWCTEAVYSEVNGVVKVEPGYAGGEAAEPSYRAVCTGTTGHAEVVQITFDPSVLSYRELLLIFFSTHDPTTLNRQGADVGTQYRSVIFYHSPEQRQAAEAMIQQLTAEQVFPAPIVTEIVPYKNFYVAEQYHHDYYKRNAEQPYCQVVIAPKLAKFRTQFSARLKG